jgi:peptide/nickel transport system permease protein
MSARQVATRFGQLFLVLLAVSVLTFAVQAAGPINRAQAMVGPAPDLTPAQRTQLIATEAKLLGLDRPLPVQYGIWLWRAVQLDFGTAANGIPVRSAVAQRLGPSIELALASALVSVPVALGLALAGAMSRRRRWPTRVLDVGLVTWLVLPSFWVGILLVLVFSIYTRWLPASGYVSFGSDPAGHIAHLVLPTITLALPQVAIYYRYLQEGLGRAMSSQYVRTARAKGLTERATLITHALPNALLPMLTIFGVYLGTLIGGIVVVENVFNWPGVGSLLVYSVGQSDYNTTVAIVLASAVFFVVISATVDIAQAVLDPRVRRS